MSFALSLVAVIAGLLAASSVVIKKLPNAAEAIEKIKPYEGFIGAAALVMGILGLFNMNFRIGFLNVAVVMGCVVSCIVMGFLLGYPVLQDLLLDELSEETRKKSEDLYDKLTPYKITAGLVAIFTGIYSLFFIVL